MNISVAVGVAQCERKKNGQVGRGWGGSYLNRVHDKKDICSLECSPALENK